MSVSSRFTLNLRHGIVRSVSSFDSMRPMNRWKCFWSMLSVASVRVHRQTRNMTERRERSWHILALGKDPAVASKAEKHLHELGYINAKVIGLDNNDYDDEKLIHLFKERPWDGISIGLSDSLSISELWTCVHTHPLGSGINGYDEVPPKQPAHLYRFNHLVNLIHQHAPQAKFIFVTGPADVVNSIERVLGWWKSFARFYAPSWLNRHIFCCQFFSLNTLVYLNKLYDTAIYASQWDFYLSIWALAHFLS